MCRRLLNEATWLTKIFLECGVTLHVEHFAERVAQENNLCCAEIALLYHLGNQLHFLFVLGHSIVVFDLHLLALVGTADRALLQLEAHRLNLKPHRCGANELGPEHFTLLARYSLKLDSGFDELDSDVLPLSFPG